MMRTKAEFFRDTVYNIRVMLADIVKLKSVAEETVQHDEHYQLMTTLRPEDWERYCVQHEIDINNIDVSRCTIPLAMVCFAALDNFGRWLKKNLNEDFGHSAHVFLSTLCQCTELDSIPSREKLRDYFRNGIIHAFFPSTGYNISYPNYHQYSVFISISADSTTLNVLYLSNLTISGLEFLKDALEEGAQLADDLYEGYLLWQRKDCGQEG